MRLQTTGASVGAFLVMAACAGEPASPPRPIAPAIDAASVASSQNNVLSAIVAVNVSHAHSVGVRYHLPEASAGDSLTPAGAALFSPRPPPLLPLVPPRPQLVFPRSDRVRRG